MKIVKDLGLFRATEEYEYTPTLEELYFYYSGTHAGYTKDNLYYTPKTFVLERRYMRVATQPQPERDKTK